MKKNLLIVALLFGFATMMSAQVDGKALGLRFGFGGEVSYLHPLNETNRVELDLGLSSWKGGLYLNGTYQWVNDLSSLADGFNWYYGGGLGLGFSQNGVGLGILGQIGIEYNLPKHPFQFSLDWRPGLYVAPAVGLGWTGVAASVRYKF